MSLLYESIDELHQFIAVIRVKDLGFACRYPIAFRVLTYLFRCRNTQWGK